MTRFVTDLLFLLPCTMAQVSQGRGWVLSHCAWLWPWEAMECRWESRILAGVSLLRWIWCFSAFRHDPWSRVKRARGENSYSMSRLTWETSEVGSVNSAVGRAVWVLIYIRAAQPPQKTASLYPGSRAEQGLQYWVLKITVTQLFTSAVPLPMETHNTASMVTPRAPISSLDLHHSGGGPPLTGSGTLF